MIVDSQGAKRSDAKPMYRKVPLAGLRRLALTLTEGSLKYDQGLYHSNWRAGSPEFAAACFDHAIEHMYKAVEGDTTEDHWAHAAANLFFIMHFEEQGVWTPYLNYKDNEVPEVATSIDEDDEDLSDEDFAILFEDDDEELDEIEIVPEPSEKLKEAATNWKRIFGLK